MTRYLRPWSICNTGIGTTALPKLSNSSKPVIGGNTLRNLFGALAAVALCGCASDDSAGRFLVAPDRYVLYNCTQLADAAQLNFTRQQELEKLMAKAEAGSGGTIASNLAYRPEYVQLRGEMNELLRTAGEKNCKTMPGTGSLTGRASDQAVR